MHQRQWERAPDGTIRRVSSVRPGAADETASPPERYRPRVGRAIAASLRDLYDYLGSFLVASALFSLLLVSLFLGASQAATRLTGKAGGTGFLLPFVACLIPSLALLMGPFTAGLFRFAHCVAARQDPDLLDLTWGCHEAFGKSVRLALVQAVVAAILVVDFLFFAGWLGSGSHTAWPGALAIFFVYALAVWALMCLYQWALLAGQEAPVGAAVRKSALLLLDN
ncbi:MAG: hypothetical protein HY320_14405, partial [Armatimonadetes bacterium]|nr:hypothetical protein [Armatimonadota bacterium]